MVTLTLPHSLSVQTSICGLSWVKETYLCDRGSIHLPTVKTWGFPIMPLNRNTCSHKGSFINEYVLSRTTHSDIFLFPLPRKVLVHSDSVKVTISFINISHLCSPVLLFDVLQILFFLTQFLITCSSNRFTHRKWQVVNIKSGDQQHVCVYPVV